MKCLANYSVGWLDEMEFWSSFAPRVDLMIKRPSKHLNHKANLFLMGWARYQGYYSIGDAICLDLDHYLKALTWDVMEVKLTHWEPLITVPYRREY